MKVVEILDIAAAAYPEEYLRHYYHANGLNAGEFNQKGSGDTLAEFIVKEIISTYDPERTSLEQLKDAHNVMQRASSELDCVVNDLYIEMIQELRKKHEHQSSQV